MVSVAAARRIALGCPEAVEGAHQGHPDFRVGGKIYMTLWPSDRRAVVKLPLADQQALVQMDHGGLLARRLGAPGLDGRPPRARERGAAPAPRGAAWRNVAPKRLLDRLPPVE